MPVEYALETIHVDIKDYVAVLTMDNPPVNAFSRKLQDEIRIAFDRISDDDDVRAAVLTGKGRVFCAGADLKNRGGFKGPGGQSDGSRSARETFLSIVECAKPVIGALNGPALGAGLAVAASCDILIAAERGSLGLPEIDVGLMGGGRHTMRLFGHSLARRMAFTGYRVPGSELYRLGIVEACVPEAELMPAAVKMAAEIASKAPIAAQLFKHTMNTIEEMTLRDGYRYEQDMTAKLGKTEDAKEAMRAFVEKRKPVFHNR